MQEIVGALVCHDAAIEPGWEGAKVEFAPLLDRRSVRARCRFRISMDLGRESRDEIQFARRRHLAVSRKDLLEKRRAGAVHTANEDRRTVAMFLIGGPNKGCNRSVNEALSRCAIVGSCR